jgi:N-acetylglucosamine-6-sulfatase
MRYGLVKTARWLAASGCLAALLGAQAAGPPREAAKPNIVVILTDGLAMNLVPYMPNVQAMQKDGATFVNYFVSNSLCCPSRSSIFTGKFPHNTGVLTNVPPEGGFASFNAHGDDAHTFALALQHAGYQTAMMGKYLNGYMPRRAGVPAGWNVWDVAGDGYPEFNYDLNQNGRVQHYGSDPAAYLTDVLASTADAFIRRSASGPFFLEVATFAPHAPYIPAPRHQDKFPGLTAPRSPAFSARPDAAAPAWLKAIPPIPRAGLSNLDRIFRMRAQSVQAVDEMIGRLRATAAELGIDNRTWFVFSSDNGLHLGEYSLRPGKMTPFDTDIHVPLIVVGPGVPKAVTLNELVENVDLAPTFTEIAGESSPTTPDGHSFLALLLRSTPQPLADTAWRRAALIEHHHPADSPADPDHPLRYSANPPSYEALRTAAGLYVEYQGGENSYYDLTRDPYELRNIVASLSPEALKRLHAVLRANAACKGAAACWDAARLMP